MPLMTATSKAPHSLPTAAPPRSIKMLHFPPMDPLYSLRDTV